MVSRGTVLFSERPGRLQCLLPARARGPKALAVSLARVVSLPARPHQKRFMAPVARAMLSCCALLSGPRKSRRFSVSLSKLSSAYCWSVRLRYSFSSSRCLAQIFSTSSAIVPGRDRRRSDHEGPQSGFNAFQREQHLPVPVPHRFRADRGRAVRLDLLQDFYIQGQLFARCQSSTGASLCSNAFSWARFSST